MITAILSAFAASLVVNLFVILFGKQDLAALKERMSLGKYAAIVDDALAESLGDTATTLLKLAAIGIALLFLLTHLIETLIVLAAIAAGAYVAKSLYRVSFVNAILNKGATYVNRLRNR